MNTARTKNKPHNYTAGMIQYVERRVRSLCREYLSHFSENLNPVIFSKMVTAVHKHGDTAIDRIVFGGIKFDDVPYYLAGFEAELGDEFTPIPED